MTMQAPDALSGGDIDMCESCPDMTMFEGRLVNSCRLDEYRKFDGSLSLGKVDRQTHDTREPVIAS
jgi:hypothetical protein